MHLIDFINYKKEYEDSIYQEFVNASYKEIKEANLYLPDIVKIIPNISTPTLKKTMKDKLFNIFKQYGIVANDGEYCLFIFSEEEKNELIKNDLFWTSFHNWTVNEKELIDRINDISFFSYLIRDIKDIKLKYDLLKRMIEPIKHFSNKQLIVNLIENQNNNNELYRKLIDEYYLYLPQEYKYYLAMNNDSNYLFNKRQKFIDQDIDIGIDPRIKIGPEIEANRKYSYILNLNSQNGYTNYKVGTDATVPNGNEIATIVPFQNTTEEIATFCALCEGMTDIGYYYDEEWSNASGQINLGLDYLDSAQAILNFYEIFGNCEELLYYISHEEGQLFRQDVYCNSRIKAISEIIGKRIIEEEISREQVIKLFNIQYNYDERNIKNLIYKKNSVCLRGSNEYDYRLEIRIPNGGCNYKTWIDNIRLYGKIMEISKRLADLMHKDYLSEEEQHLLDLKISLQNNDLSLEEKLVMLMNLLFKDNNIKKIYYNRFISVIKKIKETGATNYQKHVNNYEKHFDEVEFISQYHSRIDPDYTGNGIISFDPVTGEYLENNQKRNSIH